MKHRYEFFRNRFLHGFSAQLIKITMLLILFVVFSSITYSPMGTLKGRIFDKDTKESIPFANIVIELEGKQIGGANSDFDGKYIIKPIPPGTYDLRATYVGYNTVFIKGMIINADQIRFYDIEMESSAESLPEIVVTDYEIPLINKDETVSGAFSRDGERDSREDATTMYIDGIRTLESAKHSTKEASKGPTNARESYSRLLTAGEINDFSKWKLWKDISQNELSQYQQTWNIRPEIRYCVQVMNKKSFPIVGCFVKLIDEQENIAWVSKTDNTGKAEVWANMFDLDPTIITQYRIQVEYGDLSYLIKKPKEFRKGINTVTLKVPCDSPKEVDILFTVDATGSMGDEIRYLKAELNDIIVNFSRSQPDLKLHLGTVFYRDKSDDYITKESDFSENIQHTIDFIESQGARGGGDYPEAVDQALDVSINNLTWSKNARTKLLFLILDAPPHYQAENITRIQQAITDAAKAGIKVIPITASGIDKSTEYLMRSIALATNGTYVFLTDDSGIGLGHIKPSIDDYNVELLNDLITRLLIQNTHIENCTNLPEPIAEEKIEDKEMPGIVEDVETEKEITESDSEFEKKEKNKASTLKIKDKSLIKVYPNPTRGPVTIEHNLKVKEMFVIDISGKILQRHECKNKNLTEIDLSVFPNGLYFLKYANVDHWEYAKVILKH